MKTYEITLKRRIYELLEVMANSKEEAEALGKKGEGKITFKATDKVEILMVKEKEKVI